MALRGHGIVVYLSIRRTNGEAVSPWLIAIWVTCARAPGTPAVRGVVDALANHRVVAIAEAHLLRQANEFYVSLVRDTEFQRIAPDIVIEFASRQSQPLLDRYVMRGDSLPLDTRPSIWRNTTKVASWDSPVDEPEQTGGLPGRSLPPHEVTAGIRYSGV
jgi:hypothetical protein